MDLEHAELGKHAAVAPVFATIALFLSAVGLFAVIAHSVTQRTKEIGIRMAIGAVAADVRRMVFREGMVPVVVGLFAGLAASLAVNRLLQSQLVGVSPYDPVTMIGAPFLLIVVALAACQLPARRAVTSTPSSRCASIDRWDARRNGRWNNVQWASGTPPGSTRASRRFPQHAGRKTYGLLHWQKNGEQPPHSGVAHARRPR